MSKYSNLVEEINKQEEVKEQKANLDNELQLLKQAISNLHDSIQKVEKARKDGADMVIAMKAATDSMDMAVFAFCRAVTRAEATVLKVEMTDECLTAIQSAREKLIQSETDLLASHRRLQLQEFRNQNEEIMSFIKSCQGVFLSPKVLVVGWYLIRHFAIFTLVSIAVAPSLVEVVIRSYLRGICIWVSDCHPDMYDAAPHIRMAVIF